MPYVIKINKLSEKVNYCLTFVGFYIIIIIAVFITPAGGMMSRGQAFRRDQHQKRMRTSLQRKRSDLEGNEKLTDRDWRQVGVDAETPKRCSYGDGRAVKGPTVQEMKSQEYFDDQKRRFRLN